MGQNSSKKYTGVSKKSRPFQIQIMHSLLYYFECFNRFELMDA